MLTVNAMGAADSVLVPMQCEYYALEGLTALMDTIAKLSQVVNKDLHIEGILRTMYDPRNRLANDVSEQLKRHFGDLVYRTVIPRNVRLLKHLRLVLLQCITINQQQVPKHIWL